MKEQEIIEGNRLIAEFMGWTETDNDLVFSSNINGTTSNSVFSGWIKKEQKYTRGVPLFVVKNNRKQIDYMRKNLKYHSSWDWLMPVLEKIEKNFWVTTTTRRGYSAVSIHQPQRAYEKIARVDSENKLEATWKAIVEFIKWYNECQKEK